MLTLIGIFYWAQLLVIPKSTNMGINLWVQCITDTKVRLRQIIKNMPLMP